MKHFVTAITNNSWFETVYKIGVGVKGFDGLVELIAGLTLLISPSAVHQILGLIIQHANIHHGQTAHFIAENVAHVDGELAHSGLAFLIVFLIGHGVVKLALVYCLLREIIRAYPYALMVLWLFLIYQLYVFVVHPTLGMALFSLLDAVIIWLVWGEYKKLQAKKVV